MNELLSLDQLFEKRIFRIPDYQRGYSWENQQIDEFWDDLNNIPEKRDHYTGMIALKYINNIENEKGLEELGAFIEKSNLENDENDKYKVCHIVDGQQRLTTIIIFLNEIISFVKSLEENNGKSDGEIKLGGQSIKSISKKYLLIDDAINPTYIFGYQTDNPSDKYFKNRILKNNNMAVVEESYYTRKLLSAKNRFHEYLKNFYKNHGSSESLDKLYRNLTHKLKFNLYELVDENNVHISFETMNNRGKKLSTLELLKNRLIYLTTLYNDLNAKVVRKNINEAWKEIYRNLGKNKDVKMDDDEFLQAHWIIYFGYSRTKDNNFVKFLLNKYFVAKRIKELEFLSIKIDDQNEEIYDIELAEEFLEEKEDKREKKDKYLTLESINDYVLSLKSLAPYWYLIRAPYADNSEFTEEQKEWLEKLNRIGFAYFKPLTTVVMLKNIKNEEKVEYLKAVERWIFLHFRLCKYFQTYKNSLFYNKARDLYRDKISIKDILKELADYTHITNGIINEQSVLDRIKTLFNYNGFYSWAAIRYFLYEYEKYLEKEISQRGDTPQLKPEEFFKVDKKDTLSIEHICPQKPTNDYWQERFGKYTEKEIHIIKNSLGNLLPLSLSINIKNQNDSFPDKVFGTPKRKSCYNNGSYSEREVAKEKDWTFEKIKARGLKLLGFMENRWNFKFESEDAKLKVLNLYDIKSFD